MPFFRSAGSNLNAPRARRLFRRYFAFIGGAISAVLLLAVAIEALFTYRATLESVGDVQVTEARSAALRVDAFLHSVEEVLRESSSIPWTSPPFTASDGRAEQYRLMKIVPSIDSIQLVSSDAKVRMAVSRRELDRPTYESFPQPELLDRAVQRGAAVGPVAVRGGLEPVVAFAVHSPQSRSFVVAELNLRTVSDIVTGLRVGSAGRAFLADAENKIVAHPDPVKTMRAPSADASAQIASLRRALGEGAVAKPMEVRSSDGIEVLASAVALPRWGWLVVAEEPLEVALAPVRATLYRMLALVVLGLLVAFVVSNALARRLARPIESLREGTEKVAAGDLQSRIDVDTGDEVEELARDFNAMAAQLHEYTTGLEHKVEEKTSELQDALQVAQNAMRARALFLAAASHDLRQPLYAISILADTLALEPLPANARETLARQREAISVLRGLFDNLLDLSRFDSGEIRLHRRAVSLREVLTPIALEHEVVCRAKGLEWRCEIADGWVETDPELVRRIVSNLLSNAVRYTTKGHVSLAAERVGGHFRLVVSDTGVGIARQDQARVFEEFVQLGNPSRERDRGVGLGLSIVRKISDLLQANLRLDSDVGRGTRVSIDVPVLESVSPEIPIALVEASRPELAGMRVWAVEDDSLVREALKAQFESWGVDYAFAVTRADVEALREADGDWPEAVMLDDMLGLGERGLAIAEWLGERMPRDRIVIVTGNVQPADAEALLNSGFTILRKPLASVVIAQWLFGRVRDRGLATEVPSDVRAG